jgi:hypothetical protein
MSVHSTHKMRYSDSSYYDEICDACMQPDLNTHTNVKLTEPCTKDENVTVDTVSEKQT